ncbi:MAG: hypothetical protein AB7O57_14030 [Hyphomicrobiaceae bacterium]
MHLNHLGRIYFNHIPKTAGTSFRIWLERLFEGDAMLPIDHLAELEKTKTSAIAEKRLLSGHFGWRMVELASHAGLDIEPITLLREPLLQYASGREFVGQLTEADLSRAGVRLDVDTSSGSMLPGADTAFANSTVRHLAHWGTQVGSPIRVDRSTFETAKQRLSSLRFFGLVEDWERTAVLFADAFGLPLRRMRERWNMSGGRQRAGIDPAFAEAVQTCCAYDCELYAFARDLFESRWDAVARKHGLQPDSPPEDFQESLLHQFLATERGVARIADGTIPISSGMITEGFAYRYRTPEGAWQLWSGPELESVIYLPLDRSRLLTLDIDFPVFMGEAIRDGIRIRIDEEEVAIGRHFPRDARGNYFTRLTVSVPPAWRRLDPQYSAVQFIVPHLVATGRPEFASDVAFALGGSIVVRTAITH